MQFRLTYRGSLPAEGRGTSSRMQDKHRIRRQIRPQLAELWRTHPFLKRFMEAHVRARHFNPEVSASTLEELNAKVFTTEYDDFSVAQKIAKRFPVKGYNFLPLIGSDIFGGIETACALEILFLRREPPGRIVSGGGDIDNRLKVLLDGLKMPKPGEFEPKEPPDDNEDPFFCLIADDSLISEIRITTDRLLTPQTDGEHTNDVHLVIHVRTILTVLTASDTGAAAAFSTSTRPLAVRQRPYT